MANDHLISRSVTTTENDIVKDQPEVVDSPVSPVSVVRLLALHPTPVKMTELTAPLISNDDDHRPQQTDGPKSLNDQLPPISHVTVVFSLPPQDSATRTDVDDTDDDLSCLSTDEDQVSAAHQRPRSIFEKYWANAREAPTSIRRQRPEAPSVSSTATTSSSTHLYEKALESHEQGPRLRRSARRRSIFNIQEGLYCKPSVSAPELTDRSRHRMTEDHIRKTQSTSTLLLSRRSILRSTGRSTDSTTAAIASDRSVTFSPNVKVALFEAPAERYAPEGWSSWFH